MADQVFTAGEVLTAAALQLVQPWTGTSTISTSGSGTATITHGAPFTPTVVLTTAISGGSPLFLTAVVTAITSTTFTVRCWDNTGASVNSQSNIKFGWVACG